ncbi:hypothetical protein PYW07_000555 [Mythimna separata]|uniref:Chorein N-terminal domain-containing protein n=1 Tax=Mythimna separata TaxID=271217 RepID=A0AAD7Z3C8_MYTSE|nr:hypothetical protein PYW07_000555 [Mythimna separata]
MFKIESYVTPILLSYVDKYVRDFKPADAQVSLWGGGVALHNLVLKGDVLQQEVSLPFTLVSGRIHELLIQVPWTKIMSEPIVVTIDTIECVLSLNPPTAREELPVVSASANRKNQVVEAPPGYMQALVRRIVSNIALRVHHLIVKYVQDDIVLSLNVKHLAVDSAGANWEPAFADIDQVTPLIRRLVRLDDLTLCLDKSDTDGKIRFFQEPLLYRCQLDLRVLTRLLSATTRRATSLDVQLRSGKLAWSVSNDQLELLLRLIKERPVLPAKPTPPPKNKTQSVTPTPPRASSGNTAEPTRSESWSEWAWSWLPSWADREVGVEETPPPATPLPISFNAFLDDVSIMFKVMENDSQNRKRARTVLELCALHAALISSVCNPTAMRVRFGAREFVLRSHGKCVCGYVSYLTAHHEATVFLRKIRTEPLKPDEGPWTWPERLLNEKVVETGKTTDEDGSTTSSQTRQKSMVSEGDAGPSTAEKPPAAKTSKTVQILEPDPPKESEPPKDPEPPKEPKEDFSYLWTSMAPLFFVDYVHERSPPDKQINPYDNPPKDFEYSDWVEECSMLIVVEPTDLRMCIGLVHRLLFLKRIFDEQMPPITVQPKNTLTVEENEALQENLPQRRIKLSVRGVCIRLIPWNHLLHERPAVSPIVLEVELPDTKVAIIEPLYAHRVCSAACQLPQDQGPLWQAARRNTTISTVGMQVRLANSSGTETRPCARVEFTLVLHDLLHKHFFQKRNSTALAYHIKIKEMSICGSSARLQAACEVVLSLINQRHSIPLKHTTLPRDALNDQEAVAIDIALENIGCRGYLTTNVQTHFVSMSSAKVTAHHSPKRGEIKQAWLFSAPDVPSSTPYIRAALQWCRVPMDTSFDFCGIWTEPLAVSVDPLLISWLAYKPTLKSEASLVAALKTMAPSQITLKRRATPPSSSGRGQSRGSICAELVHVRSRSQGSGSELSDKKETKVQPITKRDQTQDTWLSVERLNSLHERLRSMLLNVELGLALVYVTMTSASAIDCATLRDAMERHAAASQRVLGICLGRLSVKSNTMSIGLWNDLESDGPTFVREKLQSDSFPWKITLADVSCYTLEVREFPPGVLGQEQHGASSTLKSKLKIPRVAIPRTVLELVTTTITVSVITKTMKIQVLNRKDRQNIRAQKSASTEDAKTQYFKSGLDFRPTTLKEFVRGPSGRTSQKGSATDRSQSPPKKPSPADEVEEVTKDGPVVSLGINLHADTPPIVIRLEQDQVHMVAAAIHCFEHIITLLKRPLQVTVSKNAFSSTTVTSTHKSVVRTEEVEVPSPPDARSEPEEMVAIFDSAQKYRKPIKTFFWFQWVVSRVTVVVASDTVKMALNIDDVINSVDIQQEYKQFKIKLASASIKHFKKTDDEWIAGAIGGRVLEAREPANAEEDAHFMSVTITQAQIADLPPSWKEELHPKLLERSPGVDYMWEVFATLAPLEGVVQPNLIENIMTLVREIAPRAYCPLSTEIDQSEPECFWPYIYLNAGGIRLLVMGEPAQAGSDLDDTIVFSVGKISVNPHPENPICRRAVTPDGVWMTASGGLEGRQYEILVSSVSVQSSQYQDILRAEPSATESKKGTTSENPALKWTQKAVNPDMTPILYPMELSCIFAPPLYANGALTCGPAIEINLVSDCSLDFSIAQLVLLRGLAGVFLEATGDPRFLDENIEIEVVDQYGTCPYANYIMTDQNSPSDTTLFENVVAEPKTPSAHVQEFGRMASDSGVESVSSKTKVSVEDVSFRKSLSVIFRETPDASNFLEVFITMGVIDLSLRVSDDGSEEVASLRPPKEHFENLVKHEKKMAPMELLAGTTKGEDILRRTAPHSPTTSRSRSLTELVREADGGCTNLELPAVKLPAGGDVQLLRITLFQPNVYFWRRKTKKTLQLSLFNLWVGLGEKDRPCSWNVVLLSTAKGMPDPVTDIKPALATFKMITPMNTSGSSTTSTTGHGTIRLDVERPMQLDVSTDKLLRCMAIMYLLDKNLSRPSLITCEEERPFLFKLKNTLVNESIELITITTGQISVCGSEGVVGWDSSSLQVNASARPERLTARGLVTALMVAAGPPGDRRQVVLQPLILGMEGDAFWEAWRRAEGGTTAHAPSVDVSVELDDINIDLRPEDLAALNRLKKSGKELAEKQWMIAGPPTKKVSTFKISERPKPKKPKVEEILNPQFQPSSQDSSFYDVDGADHYYKDDLRSGAFKILHGGQLPMAYQVMLSGDTVSWRYPHPRAITRIVAFPLPGQDKEIECVLELHNGMLGQWEPHTYFKLPVGEPRELSLYVEPPETVFAVLWRFRACVDPEPQPAPYAFHMRKFLPRQDVLMPDESHETQSGKASSDVTAEQLSGVLRVDSYFAPRLLPRTKALVRVSNLHIHLHNSLPAFTSNTVFLEGYYVSKALIKTHRVLTLAASKTTAHAMLGSPAGKLIVVDANLSSDIMDCTTGTMEEIVEEFRVQSGLSMKESLLTAHCRMITAEILMAMHVPRLKTLQALAADWSTAYEQHMLESSPSNVKLVDSFNKTRMEVAKQTAQALEGRVALWVHNSCASTMRMGQAETDEVVPLGPGTWLAYRWRIPTAPKAVHFCLAGPTTDWKWSPSVPFLAGVHRLRIDTPDMENGKLWPGGSFLHVKVEETGASRNMLLSGRLVLGNMLRTTIMYKVRAHGADSPQWHTISSGEMPAETVGLSVVCGKNCEMVLKIKFRAQSTSWSGDIPLKECPKENVPWLVKVPTEDAQFVSVWCRVVRGRTDGRILATMWPLYVLHSHLPLDTDVQITTESLTPLEVKDKKLQSPQPVQPPPAPIHQVTPGRGTCTHLQAPGTTSARHTLSFQYKDIESPVTREAVPMHYGVTEKSVFDKRTPVCNIEDVIAEIMQWVKRSGSLADNAWPYSVVQKHWQGEWKPSTLQPRCDVTVRYNAVRAGGGCCLEIQLCPIALLCNASPVSLTLRSYDAAPLCKLQPGTAISPPSAIINKPFYMSVEMGRDTFVSSKLQVSAADPGRYGTPPAGHVALDHAAHFAILCNQKVALLTLYYEIKEHINVLGVSSSYVLINRLPFDLTISTIVVPDDVEEWVTLRPKTFKVVPPTKDGSPANGTQLCKFWLRGRWRGGSPSELRAYMCVSLPDFAYPTRMSVPIRLGQPPLRRAVALIDTNVASVPIVVTQMKQDSRWLVVVAQDPCPQFVVHNHTPLSLAVAQPLQPPDGAASSYTEPIPECDGVKWWCMLPPKTSVHYSTPAHCARFPPDAMPPHSTPSPILTFARGKEDGEKEWCSPVVTADGEQLLQYYGGLTIKLRVRTHPHSTLLELQDVDQNDISASVIRKRLMGLDKEPPVDTTAKSMETHSESELPRSGAIYEVPINLGATRSTPVDHPPKAQTGPLSYPDNAKKILKTARFISDLPAGSNLDRRSSMDLEDEEDFRAESERFRCVISGVAVEVSAACDIAPILALHLDRTAVLVQADQKQTKTTLSIADAQIDNLQYDTGQYDFAVVASTRAAALEADRWPPLWNMFADRDTFTTRAGSARLLLKLTNDKWMVVGKRYNEMTEMELRLGTLALYIEDAYVRALVDLSHLLVPLSSQDPSLSEERALQRPLRLRLLHVHPLDLTLTLHTAVRMYIALDQSPLRLSAFKLHDMMTSSERLTHALTVHYLSAAILGAGWVVGGLELLGAPGALAARVGGATGGVRGVASAAAAALLRSLSAWAGSLARNLDLLAGDEEHARRAAAARRRPPPSFVAGLVAGITNFAINILGAVGGLAHHPLVGVAVGETESGTAGLRRGLLGALTKPLSATADLVAYAGSGLLRQTGWDPVPEPRHRRPSMEPRATAGWKRDCVRWAFRLAELTALTGFVVLVDDARLQLLLTHKFLVIADPDTEKILEMIDFRSCSLGPYEGEIIDLVVRQKKQKKLTEPRVDEDDEYQISAAAMARVARYTGADGGGPAQARVLSLLPLPGRSHALHAALTTALHHNAETHFPIL